MVKKVKYILVPVALGILVFLSFACKKKPEPRKAKAVHTTKTAPIPLKLRDKILLSKAQRLDSLFNMLSKTTKFNGNVLIAQNGKVIYKKCFGFSNFETKKPLEINSAFQLASTSKPFTSLGILMLKERGLLSLDDTLQKFFPEFPYKNITVRMLLSHRSGLSNYVYFTANCKIDCSKPLTNSQTLELMVHYKPASYFKPNLQFKYCNTNYVLLALIIEQVSKQTFESFMKENIFDPLDMKSTWVYSLCHDTLPDNMTYGYTGYWKKDENNYLDGAVGDKNIYSTIEDMYKFDRALYTDKLVLQSTLQESYKPTDIRSKAKYKGKGKKRKIIAPSDHSYGLGWRIIQKKDSSENIIYHNGWWHGYNSLFIRRPKDESLIVVLCNKYNPAVYHADGIMQILNSNDLDIESEPENVQGGSK